MKFHVTRCRRGKEPYSAHVKDKERLIGYLDKMNFALEDIMIIFPFEE